MSERARSDLLCVRRGLFRPGYSYLIVQSPDHADRPMALALFRALVDRYIDLLFARGDKAARFACPMLVLCTLAAGYPLLHCYAVFAFISPSGCGAFAPSYHHGLHLAYVASA
jgi:hypothetical protein